MASIMMAAPQLPLCEAKTPQHRRAEAFEDATIMQSCTSIVWVIPVARKRGIMPPFHHRVRGRRGALKPIFLPTAAGGTAVAVPDAAWYVASRARPTWLDPPPTSVA